MLLLGGSISHFGLAPAQAQQLRPASRWAAVELVSKDTTGRKMLLPMKHLAAAQPVRTTANRNGLCDLLTNGDFEIQTNNIGPTTYGNIGNPTTEVTGWVTPNGSSPDYYATNGSSPDIVPATGIYGTFSPFGGKGSVGLGTLERNDGTRVSEYISTTVANVKTGHYYASFQVQVSNGGASGISSTRGVQSGFGFQVSSGFLGYIPGSSGGYDFLRPSPSNCGLLTSSALTQANVGVWTPVTGQFDIAKTDVSGANVATLTVGLFNANRADRDAILINGSTSAQDTRTYFFVDNIELFKVPTAGPDQVYCPGSSVTIGEGCDIPNAKYAWRIDGQQTPFAYGITTQVAPTGPTRYSLTVTLPDNSIYVSYVNVTLCPPIIYGPDVMGCGQGPFTFQASPTNGTIWQVTPANLVTSSSGYGSTFTTNAVSGASGQITITATFYNYPGGTRTVSKTVTIQGPPPIGPILAEADHTAGRLTATISPLQGISYYNWYKDGVLLTTNHNASVIWIIPRSGCDGYTVRVEAVTPCGTTQTSVFAPGMHCDNVRTSEVYPNPATDKLMVSTRGTNATTTLLDARGNVRRQMVMGNGRTRAELDVSGLPAGMYLLRIVEQDGTTSNQQVSISR